MKQYKYNNTKTSGLIGPPIIRCVYLYMARKDGFVRGSYKYNQNMGSPKLYICFGCFVSINMPYTWHCSGQSENWNWHKNLCFNYNVSCYALSITPRKIKQHQKIVPIKFIDLLLWECPTCVAFHHSESANYQTQDWKPNPEILILDSDYIHAIPIFFFRMGKRWYILQDFNITETK